MKIFLKKKKKVSNLEWVNKLGEPLNENNPHGTPPIISVDTVSSAQSMLAKKQTDDSHTEYSKTNIPSNTTTSSSPLQEYRVSPADKQN